MTESKKGCSCGSFVLPFGEVSTQVMDVVHRNTGPCYRVGQSKQVPAKPRSLEDRVVALEKLAARAAQRHGPLCTACGCSWVEHQGHVTDAWELEAGACLSCSCTRFEGKP